MKKIAILGYGVVGSGITRVLERNAEKIARAAGDAVEVKYILDLRDFPDSPYGDRIVRSIDTIARDPEIAVVCEAMGGSHPAFEYSVRCMENHKSVVTSNKELVANFGDELLGYARKYGVNYLFEASVGGGIPLIRPFATSLAGDTVTAVSGIVNGTTNYILTKMKNEGLDFADALAEAQRLGYAERDPAADIDGIDAKRKIMILTALSTGILPADGDVYAGSLRNLTLREIAAASRMGGELKLIARAESLDGTGENGESIHRCAAYVSPMIVPESNPLAHVEDVYNAVSFTSPVTGDILYYGRGAGSLPTAGAIMADVCAALSGAADAETSPRFEKRAGAVIPFETLPMDFYVRTARPAAEAADALSAVCERAVSLGTAEDGETEFSVTAATDADLREALPGSVRIPVLR